MKGPGNPMAARSKAEIIADIEAMASRPGFIYTLMMLISKDLFYAPSESVDRDWDKSISFQEFGLIIGLMVKRTVSLEFPYPEQVEADLPRIYELLRELHDAHNRPFMESFSAIIADGKKDLTAEEAEEEKRELFGSGNLMAEAVFYSESGAYDFQYAELAPKKYALDSAWLSKNKGLSIKTVVEMAAFLKSHVENSRRECLKGGLPGEVHEDVRIFYSLLLKLFTFRRSDLKGFGADDIEALLSAFSLVPGEVNAAYDAVGKYNALESHPIIKLDEDLFFLPIHFYLSQSIYESPFYWMFQDADYKDEAASHRGKTTEEIAYEMLRPIFGSSLYRDIRVRDSAGRDITDIDLLAVLGNKAVVIQAKSKRLTELARIGDTERLKADFEIAVQKAYDQGIVCRDAVLTGSNKLFDANGKEIRLSEVVDEAYVVCLVSDHYPALTSQIEFYLKRKADQPSPIGVSLFDLDILSFYLRDPFEFLYYVRQRVSLSGYYRAGSEMEFLGFHLNRKLFADEKFTMAMVGSDFAQLIDANFPVMKGRVPHTEAVERLHHKWKNDKYTGIIEQVKATGEPGFTDAIFHLYDIAGDGGDELVRTMELTLRKTRSDGQCHDFSAMFGTDDIGISFISHTGSPVALRESMMRHATTKKYKTKAKAWLAMGHLAGSDRLVDALAFTKEPWEYDPELEALADVFLKRGKPIGKGGVKVGRNDKCTCGSGKKFKKCCGA